MTAIVTPADGLASLCATPPDRCRSSAFRLRQAAPGWEREQAARLRREVFCNEQGLFAGDDLDAIDARPETMRTLVALSDLAGEDEQVVGTVRIHEAEAGVWWGSRLAVAPDFRRVGVLGAALIRLAVGSARAQGCHCFLAHVQQRNVPLFRRLHWHDRAELQLHGRPHRLMEADLSHFSPCLDPRSGFVVHVDGSGR